MRLAVVLFNLGGPDSPSAVEPFLRNLFSDPAILPLPPWLCQPAARLIAKRRAPVARAIYERIGGKSPILEQTAAQADALEQDLVRRGAEVRVFVAMRAWHPMSDETAEAVAAFAPDCVVLLPLYPQFSTTTTASSLSAWRAAAEKAGLSAEHKRVCCYPWNEGFIKGLAERVRTSLLRRRPEVSYRLLFSAHGLPQRIVDRGDPYRWQIERTVGALVHELGNGALDWRISYQSRVGPLKWLAPATDEEIRRAGAEGKGLVVVPVAFVSEHSETLVELDIDYAALARKAGVPDYLRAATVGTSEAFIRGLGDLVLQAVASPRPVTCGAGRICPPGLAHCGMSGAGQ
ncbi:MAG TPA: ferrochelatase [Rhizomicrobium sp.]|nr:ferrochelatase [Rhizomicrobium sp.]